MADRHLHIEGFGNFPITEHEAQRLGDGKSITINLFPDHESQEELIELLFGGEVKYPDRREYTVEDMGFRPGRVHVDSVKHPNPAVDSQKFADQVRDSIRLDRGWRYKDMATGLNYGDTAREVDESLDTGFDPVDKPSHYAEGREIEPIDVIDDWTLGFYEGQVLKYISRAGRKTDSELEDLRKAKFYLDRLVKLVAEDEG